LKVILTASLASPAGASGNATTIYVLDVVTTLATAVPIVTETADISDIGNPVPVIVTSIPP